MVFSGSVSNSDDLPTFAHFCKSSGEEAFKPQYQIKVIWKPGLFPNFTLETERFRLRVPPSSQLFQLLEEQLEIWIDSGKSPYLRVLDPKKQTFELDFLQNTEVEWEELGTKGWKVALGSTKIKRAPKNSSSKTA